MPEFLLLEKEAGIGKDNIIALSNLHKGSFYKGWSPEELGETIYFNKCFFFVAKDQEEIIAMIMIRNLSEDEAEIITICTNKILRRNGLAKTLLEKGLGHLKQNNIKKIFLEVDVANQAAIKLYKKFNFTEISTRKNYYQTSIGFSDAVVMELIL